MAAHNQGLSAQRPLRYLGPVAPYTFPVRPSSVGLDALDLAADRARLAAATELEWLAGSATASSSTTTTGRWHIDTAQMAVLVDTALGLRSAELRLCERLDDGGFGETPGPELVQSQVADQLDRGAALVLRHAERASEPLNRLCAAIALSRRSVVEAVVVAGSLVESRALPPMSSWRVITLTPGTIVRAANVAPVQLAAGHITTLTDPPRLHAAPSSISLLIGEQTFGSVQRREVIVERAAHHPLLRLDIPLDPALPIELYGAGRSTLADTVRHELDEVVAVAAPDDLEWWWLLRFALAPAPLRRGIDTAPVIRGRFPGGVGVIERTPEGIVFAAAGHVLAAHADFIPVLAELVSRDPVDTAGPTLVDARHILLRCGLAEPVDPPT